MIYSPPNPDHQDEEANLSHLAPDKDLDDTTLMEKYDPELKEKAVEETNEVPLSRNARFMIWTFLNVTSTVGIVSIPLSLERHPRALR
jgi:solute carrier family 35 protein E3